MLYIDSSSTPDGLSLILPPLSQDLIEDASLGMAFGRRYGLVGRNGTGVSAVQLYFIWYCTGQYCSAAHPHDVLLLGLLLALTCYVFMHHCPMPCIACTSAHHCIAC